MSLEPKEKLIWLGLKRATQSESEVQTEVITLESSVGDYDTFQTGVSNQTSYSDFKTYLTNNGFTSDEADDFISKAQNNFNSWSDFQDYVVNQTDSYEEFRTGFGNTNTIGSELQTQGGDKISGVRFFEQAGVTKDGVDVPEGSVEVFGREVHFSQTGSSAPSTSPVTYSNITSSDLLHTFDVGSNGTISADVSNPNSTPVTENIPLIEDGSVLITTVRTIPANSTETVSFTIAKNSVECHDYAIGDTSEILVCWQGLTI